MTERYPDETLGDWDDGTMVKSRDNLAKAVVGHRIVKAERARIPGEYNLSNYSEPGLIITLDDGSQVRLRETSDCCAYTDVKQFLLHPESVDHVIIGVGTTDEYTRWHIYADFGDVLELTVAWSCGNSFFYGYGFDIDVVPVEG